MANPSTSTHLYIERHRPVLTSRIEFKLAAPRPLPLITPRIEFTPERLAYRDTATVTNQPDDSERVEDITGPDRETGQTPPRTIRSSEPGATKIPKPPGEPGRPGSGGYCVETELITTHKWTKDSVHKLTEAVRTAARKKLDVTMSFRSQKKAVIRGICDHMMQDDQWPLLKNYDDCWPVLSILKLTLKYRAEASRRAAAKIAHARLRAVLRGESPALE